MEATFESFEVEMEHMEKDIAFITSFTEILDIYLLRKRDDKKK